MALDWLTDKNKHNREIKPATLARYVRDINEDRWARTGDTIKFDPNGNLIDGQHRLKAIFDTGKAQKCLIAYNVPPESFMYIDTGAVRGGGDVLSIAGYDRSKNLAAATRFAWHIERVAKGDVGYSSIGKMRMGNDEVLAWVGQNPEIQQSIGLFTTKAATAVMSPPSLFRALHWWLAKVSESDADLFFEGLATGIGLIEGDPIAALRNSLVEERRRMHRSGSRPYWYWAAITIKAWNAYRQGKSVKQLRFATGGVNKETWPEPI